MVKQSMICLLILFAIVQAELLPFVRRLEDDNSESRRVLLPPFVRRLENDNS